MDPQPPIPNASYTANPSAADHSPWQIMAQKAPVAMALLDRRFQYVAANGLWHRLLGQPPDTLSGRDHLEMVGDQADEWLAVLRQALAGEAQTFEEAAPESGAPHQWVMAPQRDASGAVVGVAVYCQLLSAQPIDSRIPSEPLPAQHSTESSHSTDIIPDPRAFPTDDANWQADACPAVVVNASGQVTKMNDAARGLQVREITTDGGCFWHSFAERPMEERMREALMLVLGEESTRPVALPPTQVPAVDETQPSIRYVWSVMRLLSADGRVSGGYLQAAVEYPDEQANSLVRERAQRRQLEQQLAGTEEQLASLQTALEALPSPTVLTGFEWLNTLPLAAMVLEGNVVRQWNQACSALLAWPGSDKGEAGPRDLDSPPTIDELIGQRSSDDRHRGQLLKQWRQLSEQGGGQALSMKHPRHGHQELWFDLSHVDLPMAGDLRPHDPQEDHRFRLVLIRDITSERLEQSALRSSERRLRAVVNQLRAPLLITNLDGRVFDCNPAFEQLCGHSRAELLRMEWSDLLAPEHWQRCQSVVRELDEGGAGYGTNVLRLLDEGNVDGPEIGVDVILIRDQWDQAQHLAYLFAGSENSASGSDQTALDRNNNNRQIRNGLHIIHTLLDLQWHSTSVAAAREALKASQNRVQAILEAFQDGSMNVEGQVSVVGLTRALVNRLTSEAGWSHESHDVKVDGDLDRLPLERVVPVALVVNELVSFAISRALPSIGEGPPQSHLTVIWRSLEKGSKLSLQYEGPLRETTSTAIGSATLGLRIAETLAEQLGGELNTDHGPPLRFEVDLPLIGGGKVDSTG